MTTDFDVAVVGGGAAGIGSARRLAAHGMSTLLLEASGRLGGRALTREVAGHALDLGCGWLHSADRNAWTAVAEASGFCVDRRRPAWGEHHGSLGFTPADHAAARDAFAAWSKRLSTIPPSSDRASDALLPGCEWNAYVRAMTGYISGVEPEQISIEDYKAYDTASTGINWRLPAGYGTLIAASLPASTSLRLATPVERIDLDEKAVGLTTRAGTVRVKAAILTVSTSVLAGDAIVLPKALDPWRHAATLLPLGRNEKVFLGVVGEGPFAADTYLIGSPRDARTGAYHIRPFGRPIIECFLGGEGARIGEDGGSAAVFAHAIEELTALFGNSVRSHLRPLAASNWSSTAHVGGAYSCALPGEASARQRLATSYARRLFFAGEATHAHDFSTAHGAHDTGIRAADEAVDSLKRVRS